jgi:hypothetical protein
MCLTARVSLFRHIMERSTLSAHTGSLRARRGSGDAPAQYIMDGIHVDIMSAVQLGGDVMQWTYDYLRTHDGVLNPEISSCFFYHGGITIPDSLVYLAEIICVLIGAKPIVMVFSISSLAFACNKCVFVQIQYTTPTDTQWKFPMVAEVAKTLLSLEATETIDGFDSPVCTENSTSAVAVEGGQRIKHTIFRYGKDETLLFYRAEEEARVNLLKPFHTAQVQ